MEKIVKIHVEGFLTATNQINNSQHGFMKGKSCLSNLLIFQNSVINMIDEGSCVDIVYLDLQKAFDKVPHSRLMQKVRDMGICGKLADWIQNWLTDRKQRVIVNGSFSEWSSVNSGVPQGSILGPLLFTIFINDLDTNLTNFIMKFADDSKLWGRVDDEKGIKNMQKDLDLLSDWANKNQMPFNVNKCKVMHIGKKNSKSNYKIMNQKIPKTN